MRASPVVAEDYRGQDEYFSHSCIPRAGWVVEYSGIVTISPYKVVRHRVKSLKEARNSKRVHDNRVRGWN